MTRFDYEAEWTTAWPTKVGYFWFYGYAFGLGQSSKPKLETIEVWGPVNNSSGGTNYIYSAGSFFMGPEAVGLWTKMETPLLPELAP